VNAEHQAPGGLAAAGDGAATAGRSRLVFAAGTGPRPGWPGSSPTTSAADARTTIALAGMVCRARPRPGQPCRFR